MRVPEPFFVIINPMVKSLLRSPLHGLASKSLMIVTFKGRKSGKVYSTPVRYVRMGDVIRCYSSADTNWWRNLRDATDVELLTEGIEQRYSTTVIENDPAAIREALKHYLAIYPQDAAYHEIRVTQGELDQTDLERASQHAIVVEARPQ